MQKSLSRYWLLLGVTALAVGGLFALPLAMGRSVSDVPWLDAIFHKSLVVHVDLTVMLWFLSMACMFWSLLAEGTKSIVPYLEETAMICFALAMIFVAAAPLDPRGQALMSNYIPVVTSPVFFLGLALLLCGTGLMLVRILGAGWRGASHVLFLNGWAGLRFGIYTGGVIAAMMLVAFVWSQQQMPRGVLNAQDYYDLMFWGGGHVMQFVDTQMLLVAWMLLARALQPEFALPKKWFASLCTIGLATALLTPLAYLMYDIDTPEHRLFFTHAMMWMNGAAPMVLTLFVIPLLWRARGNKNALWSALAMSVLLFIYGGFLGELIQGQNVVIPAHYHGAIVGVTLAFMGAAYLLLPHFGYRDVNAWRIAFWQPVVYGGGQLMHVSGFAWSGGYGVLRKTPGGLDALPTGVKAAMGFMGLGGLLAILGGFMFVIVIAKAVRRPA